MSEETPDLLTQLQRDADGSFSYALVSEFVAKSRQASNATDSVRSIDRAAAFQAAADIVERVSERMRRTREP